MKVRKLKTALIPVLIALPLFLSLSVPTFVLAGADRPTLTGAIAYAEPMKFDYNKDGTPNTVQLWVDIDIKPAVGVEGEPGYIPEEGHIRRYMKDLALGAPIIGYNQFNMLPDNPLGEKVPASEITFSGNSASFTAGELHFTVVDGGKGFKSDSITANDGIREYPMTLFDGDLIISTMDKPDK